MFRKEAGEKGVNWCLSARKVFDQRARERHAKENGYPLGYDPTIHTLITGEDGNITYVLDTELNHKQ